MINDLDIVQWEYLLSPEFELINSAGKPLTGGWIEVYLHGTRDKYYCASDFDGTLHPFKIPLDSIGANVVLADPNNAYDVYVYNKFGSLIMSRYNVKCQGSGGSSTYVGDKLYYGQYRANNVTTIANLRRNKGNINITNDGYLKLKSGMSYHITVRGSFTVDDPTNEDTTLNYVEYTSVNPIKIDIDETKEGPQYFELSYDIYRLQEDMDYQVAFAQSNGMVKDLIVEVHSLSNLATSAAGGDQEYEAGWGIDITNNVVSVDPSILEDYEYTAGDYISIDGDNVISVTGINPADYATHEEVYEATVTAIEFVSGMIPEAQVQSDWNETDTEDPAYIKNKPDLDIYATHDEVNNVSGKIIETVNNVSGVLHDEVMEVSGSIIHYQGASGINVEGDTISLEEPLYIEAGSGINFTSEGDTITINADPIDLSDYATHDEVNTVSGELVNVVCAVSSVLQDEIDNIPPQVQSDWDQDDDTQVDYIKNKPTETELVAGQNIGLFAEGTTLTICASATDLSDYATHDEVNTVSGQIIETVNNVSGNIIETVNNVSGQIIETVNNVSGVLHEEVMEVSGSIIHYQGASGINIEGDTISLEEPLYIEAGSGINFTSEGDTITINADPVDLSDYVTHVELEEAISAVTGIGDYGQFYATNISGAATMARTKGTINVTNDGKIMLKKGSSYHVTMRGRYNQTTASNTLSTLSLIEYITNNSISVNVDTTITDSQYFEISYDLYKLNSDTNYYVFFNVPAGKINDLFVEIHAIGSVGAGVSGGAGTEYDAGWGIQILNNVISVDPTILNEFVTYEVLDSAIASAVSGVKNKTIVIPITYFNEALNDTAAWDYLESIVTAPECGVFVTHPSNEYATALLYKGYLGADPNRPTLFFTMQFSFYGSGVSVVRGYWERGGYYHEDRSEYNYLSSVSTNYTLTGLGTMNNPLSVNLRYIPTYTDINNILSSATITPDNILTYNVSTWEDYLNMSASGTMEVFADDDGNIAPMTYKSDEVIKFTRIRGSENSSDGNAKYVDYFLRPTGWSTRERSMAPTIDTGVGITKNYDIINNKLTLSINPTQVATAVSGLIPLGNTYTAGDNIEIDDNVISVKDVIMIHARPDSSSGLSAFGNVTHWGEQDYGPGWYIKAHTDNDKDYVAYNSSDLGQEEFYWGEYATNRETNGVSAVSQLSIHEGDIVYKAGEFQDVSTLPIVWSCNKMAQDIEDLKNGYAPVTGLPTTELGKFTIQNNVSGGPIEVICPTDQAPDTVFYQINTVSGYAYASSTGSAVINYYYGETPADFNGSDDAILFTINDNISNVSNINFYYVNSESAMGGPSLGTSAISGGSTGVLQSGSYKVKAQYNQAGTSSPYGKYLEIMFQWRSYASDSAQSLQWAQEALSKITFFGVVRPDPTLGAVVNLNRYELGNINTITNTYGYPEAAIYTDPISKKQSVYLPNSMPSNWSANSNIAQAFQYGTNGNSPSNTNYSTKQYRAYKYTSSPTRYQFAYCTDWDVANKLMTFVAYDNSGNAIEKWTLDYTTYGSNVWTTTPISAGSSYTAGDHISIENDEIAVTGITELVAGENITITTSGASAIISGQAGGSSYTAGTGIDITGDVISVDNTVAMKTDLPAPISGASGITVEDSVVSLDNPIGLVAGNNITIEVSGVSAIISSTGGGGSSYTAGAGIDITNNEISVDNTVALKTELPVISLNGSDQVTAIDGHTLAGGGSSPSYTAGTGIDITNDVISVNNTVAMASAIPAAPVQSNWNETDTSSLAYIQNKPTIPAAPVQSNWSETNSSSLAYIKNKPTIPAAQVQANWNETNSSSMAYIKNKPTIPSISGCALKSDLTWTGWDYYNNGVNYITNNNVGKAGFRFYPGNLFTSYSLKDWTYSETPMYGGSGNISTVFVRFCARLNNVVGTQWSSHNNVIQLNKGHIMEFVYEVCGDGWNSGNIVLRTTGSWEQSVQGILRDVRNSSTADNNDYYLHFSAWVGV